MVTLSTPTSRLFGVKQATWQDHLASSRSPRRASAKGARLMVVKMRRLVAAIATYGVFSIGRFD
jgi:hypothetical protein